jgi:hypothetical protein
MAVVGFIRNYTWLCAVGCFIVALILGSNGMRQKRAWVTSDARVAGFDDQCQMQAILPPSEKQVVWGGTVPCAEVSAKKEQHAAYPYEVTPTRTFTLEFVSPEGAMLQTQTIGTELRLPQTSELGHHLTIDYAIADPNIVRAHEGMRGLQIPILLNIFGLCLLGFAWLSHIAHGSQTTGAPTGDWLNKVDLPPDAVAGLKTLSKSRPAPGKLQPRPLRREPAPRQSAAKAGGFGRKS